MGFKRFYLASKEEAYEFYKILKTKNPGLNIIGPEYDVDKNVWVILVEYGRRVMK